MTTGYDERLKPCPFCGSKAIISVGKDNVTICCPECPNLEMYSAVEPLDSCGANWKHLTEEEMINAWNKRV